MKVKCVIDGEPVGKGRPRFYNNRVYTPEKTRAYEELMRIEYAKQCGYRFDGYIKLTVIAYYSIAKSDSKKKKAQKLSGELLPSKKPDIDNVIKMVDAWNGVAFKDDTQIVSIEAKKFFSDKPRVEFILEDICQKITPNV